MSRVFVVQIPTSWDPETRSHVEKFDLSPAEEYGELVHVMGARKLRDEDDPQVWADHVYEVMKDYQSEDYLLPIGDPALITMAVIAASSQESGVVQVLKYFRSTGEYRPVRIEY